MRKSIFFALGCTEYEFMKNINGGPRKQKPPKILQAFEDKEVLR